MGTAVPTHGLDSATKMPPGLAAPTKVSRRAGAGGTKDAAAGVGPDPPQDAQHSSSPPVRSSARPSLGHSVDHPGIGPSYPRSMTVAARPAPPGVYPIKTTCSHQQSSPVDFSQGLVLTPSSPTRPARRSPRCTGIIIFIILQRITSYKIIRTYRPVSAASKKDWARGSKGRNECSQPSKPPDAKSTFQFGVHFNFTEFI